MLTGMAGPGPARRLVHEEVIILLYVNKPHIGTDVLSRIVKAIRREIENLGGEIRFLSQVTDFVTDREAGENRRIEALVINGSQVIETETVNDVDDRAAMNQEQVKPILESVSPAEEYYLVSESGFLLVFCSDRSTICLYTHIPVTDFPEKEREKRMEGIWCPSMMYVYHYLESYTS